MNTSMTSALWKIILLIFIFLIYACNQKKIDIEDVNQKIKEQYPDVIAVSIEHNKKGKQSIVLDLHDTVVRFDRSRRLARSTFYAINDSQRTFFDSIKINFSSPDKIYFKDGFSIKEFRAEDSLKQIQYCDLLPNIFSSPNGLTIYMTEITETEFFRIAPESIKSPVVTEQYKHSDSLENILMTNHRDKFKFEDSCYHFNTADKNPHVLCRKENPANDHDFEFYNLINKFEEFFIFEVTRYEDGNYVVFDSNTGEAYSSPGYPKFSYSKRYFHSTSGYYGEGIISLQRLEDGKGVYLSFDNWDVLENYQINDEGIRFKLRSNICRNGIRYIDIHVGN